MQQRLYLIVPFAEKDRVKSLGAKWDAVQRHWYVPSGLDSQAFLRWLPPQQELLVASAVSISADAPRIESPLASEFTPVKGITLTQLMHKIAGVVQSAFSQAVWVVAEITELQQRQGHWYLTLAESQAGQQLAQVKANLWAGRVVSLQNKFMQETGDWLKAGQKVLFLCEPAVHPRFGLSLSVLDIDPSYTLGEQARKLMKIRADLKAQGLYDLNRQWRLPTIWSRVAVLSPAQAAGLGDFQRDADRLNRLGLCDFVYFHASFQGMQVVADMQLALEKIQQSHHQQPFDALVIIRGGGAQQDLMYLNEWVIAQQVAQLPLAVLTGIGHERDNTILDEIAHTPCDTPSKVIAFIREQIVQQARNGAGYWHWIKQQALLIVAQVKAQQRKVVTQIRHQAQQGLNQEKQRLQVTFHHCDKQIHAHLQQQQHQLIRLKQQTLWSAQQTLFLQKQQIRPYPQRLRQQITRQLTQQYQQLSHYHHLIQSNDPKRLLNAGYVLVRSANGQVLTQLTQAQQHPCFWLHFQDGDLLVAEVKE